MIDHKGNAANQIMFEEHDGVNFAKRVSIAQNGAGLTSLPTLNAVVNAGAAADPHIFIGLTTSVIASAPTLYAVVNTAAAGQASVALDNSVAKIGFVTALLDDPKKFIGLTTNVNGAGDRFIGLVTVVHSGNVTLNASGAYIGLVTIGGIGTVTLADPKGYIGLTTTTLGVGDRFIGLATVVHAGNVTLNAGAAFVGLATVVPGGNVTLNQSAAYIGLTTTNLGVGSTFIGLVTAVAQNAGTNKTLIPVAITLSTSSQITIGVPTNANTIKVTNIVLNSDATVRMSIKSGVTYMTGNASIGITLNPGSGFVLVGSPDSPSWLGLASGALVVEKFDMTATKANVGGHVVYFQE